MPDVCNICVYYFLWTNALNYQWLGLFAIFTKSMASNMENVIVIHFNSWIQNRRWYFYNQRILFFLSLSLSLFFIVILFSHLYFLQLILFAELSDQFCCCCCMLCTTYQMITVTPLNKYRYSEMFVIFSCSLCDCVFF